MKGFLKGVKAQAKSLYAKPLKSLLGIAAAVMGTSFALSAVIMGYDGVIEFAFSHLIKLFG